MIDFDDFEFDPSATCSRVFRVHIEEPAWIPGVPIADVAGIPQPLAPRPAWTVAPPVPMTLTPGPVVAVGPFVTVDFSEPVEIRLW